MYTDLPKLAPSAAGMALITKLYDAGFAEPVLFGGSLRDTFRNASYKDIDIKIALLHAGETRRNVRPHELEIAMSMLRTIPDLFIRGKSASYDYSTDEQDLKRDYRLRTLFNHNGSMNKADITLLGHKPTIEEMIDKADAPINAIAVDRSGYIKADQDFTYDMERCLYTILRRNPGAIADSVGRFVRIQKRFEGLTLNLDPQIMGTEGVYAAEEALQHIKSKKMYEPR